MTERYVRAERIALTRHPELSERWVQDRIAEDPSLLGLGDLILRDQERIQPRAGRLDMLLVEPETRKRFEVELQLGPTDERHIVRTIEYWDIERRRYPQYDHCAVLVAEDITSRFLNVVQILNGSVPLVAIQMQAYRVNEAISLVFTTVINELARGVVDEDEEAESQPTDRSYWEGKATKKTMRMVDDLLKLAHNLDDGFELKYNKYYIGLARNGQPYNFVTFKPRQDHLLIEPRLPQTDEVNAWLEDSGFDVQGYDPRSNFYKVNLTPKNLIENDSNVQALLKRSHDQRFGE